MNDIGILALEMAAFEAGLEAVELPNGGYLIADPDTIAEIIAYLEERA